MPTARSPTPPRRDFSGTDSFTYQASDGQLLSNVATVTITIGQPPVANDDSYSTNENTVLSVAAPGVLANDTSPSGNPLTCAILATPAHGHVILNPDGSFTYTATADFTGVDSFTYEDSDGQFISNIATVTLTVFDHPVAQDDTYGYTPNSTLTTAAAQTSVTMDSQRGDFVGQGQSYDFTPANSTITASTIRDGVIASGVQVYVTAPGSPGRSASRPRARAGSCPGPTPARRDGRSRRRGPRPGRQRRRPGVQHAHRPVHGDPGGLRRLRQRHLVRGQLHAVRRRILRCASPARSTSTSRITSRGACWPTTPIRIPARR